MKLLFCNFNLKLEFVFRFTSMQLNLRNT